MDDFFVQLILSPLLTCSWTITTTFSRFVKDLDYKPSLLDDSLLEMNGMTLRMEIDTQTAKRNER